MRKYWMVGIAVLTFAACKQEKEVIIPDNVAPPDHTVSNVVLESFINRSYIVLLGTQPNPAEMAQGKAVLRTNGVSQADRENFLGQVMAQPGYAQRLFDIGRGQLLNSTDTSEIRSEINLRELILADSAFIAVWDEASAQKDQLEAVLAIPADLAAGTLDMRGAHGRLVSNIIYDQINMGTQNFVLSVFQNLLGRYPTEAERQGAESMVDGFSSFVFLESGRTKADFVQIFMHSRDYDEGQVRDLIRRYLFRETTTEELQTLTVAYRAVNDYKGLQMAVMSTDEFLGI